MKRRVWRVNIEDDGEMHTSLAQGVEVIQGVIVAQQVIIDINRTMG